MTDWRCKDTEPTVQDLIDMGRVAQRDTEAMIRLCLSRIIAPVVTEATLRAMPASDFLDLMSTQVIPSCGRGLAETNARLAELATLAKAAGTTH